MLRVSQGEIVEVKELDDKEKQVVNGLEECFVTDKNGDVLPLDDFIKRDENKSKYEFIRKIKYCLSRSTCREFDSLYQLLETVTTSPGSWHHSQPASLLNITELVS